MIRTGATLATVFLLSCAEASVTVTDARSPAPPADVMAVYFEVTNHTNRPDTLLTGRIEGFSDLEIHETVHTDGTMVMRPVARFVIEPGTTETLRPGGLHGMVSGFTSGPAAGDTLTLTLTFAHAGEIVVPLRVVTYADLES